MRDLVALLRWTDADALERACSWADRTRLSLTAQLLPLLFAPGAPYEERQDILLKLISLPDVALGRVLSAPATFGLLSGANRESGGVGIQWLHDAIVAEQIRLCQDAPIAPGLFWTALGDCEVLVAPDGTAHTRNTMRLALGPIVDLESPIARANLRASSFRTPVSAYAMFSDRQRADVERLVARAADSLVGSAPLPAKFVRCNVQSIVPRIDLNNSTYRGSSNRGMPGRVILYNPHLPGINECNVVSSLVHESVHIFLYLVEHERGVFSDLDYAHRQFVSSPFSGKAIHVLAMVHATFVWFGILNFFLQFSFGGRWEATRRYYIDLCAGGFVGGKAWETIAPHTHMITEEFVQQLVAVQSAAEKAVADMQ